MVDMTGSIKKIMLWNESKIKLPVAGVVFIHTSKRNKPFLVSKVEGDLIYRVASDGIIAQWGTTEDWRDEI